MSVPQQIEREIVIAAPPARVWAAITEAEHIGTWFAEGGAEVDLRPGGTLSITFKEHGTFRTVIERIEPERVFSWRWSYAEGETPRPGNSTLVAFYLTPDGDGTRLRVVESGFDTLDLPVERQAHHAAENTQGWLEELAELQAYVERQRAA